MNEKLKREIDQYTCENEWIRPESIEPLGTTTNKCNRIFVAVYIINQKVLQTILTKYQKKNHSAFVNIFICPRAQICYILLCVCLSNNFSFMSFLLKILHNKTPRDREKKLVFLVCHEISQSIFWRNKKLMKNFFYSPSEIIDKQHSAVALDYCVMNDSMIERAFDSK